MTCLFRNDIACNVLQWDEGGILQEVAGHFDGRLMVRDHLHKKFSIKSGVKWGERLWE